MEQKNKQEFKELRDVWGEYATQQIKKNNAKRMTSGFFKIPFLKRIDKKKAIAILAVIINTPLPTASPITNPILYKKIMNFNTDKFQRKLNLMIIKLR